MADSYVQVAPDAGGKQIDSQAITNAAGQTIYRQTIVIADPVTLANMAIVDNAGFLQTYAAWDKIRATFAAAAQQLAATQGGPGNGFCPIETPDFFIGV